MIALVTGARGFIGRHLSHALNKMGNVVCGVGHGAWTDSERGSWGVQYWLNGDVTKRNLEIVQSQVGSPDLVFHLAGGSSVGLSLLAPEEDFRRSVLASAELLEWARLSAKDANLVLVSSAAVYGAGHSKPILESEAVAPYSPYGYNKRISEELFESYSKNFGLNVAIVRLFSVYGQELRKQLLWDSCCRLLNDDKSLLLGGTGKEVRDWFHVQDAVELIQLAANFARKDCLIVNGGAGIPMSVREIAEALCDSWGSATSPVFSGTVRAGDPHYLVADMNLAMTLGFEPVISWQTGVSNYVEWFKQVNIKAV